MRDTEHKPPPPMPRDFSVTETSMFDNEHLASVLRAAVARAQGNEAALEASVLTIADMLAGVELFAENEG